MSANDGVMKICKFQSIFYRNFMILHTPPIGSGIITLGSGFSFALFSFKALVKNEISGRYVRKRSSIS